MAGIDTTTGGMTWGTGDFYTAIMNEMALPMVADTVIYPNALLSRLPRRRDRVRGKAVEFTIHTDDANGAVALGADATLPEPDNEHYARYNFFIRSIYVRMKIDGLTADASEGSVASWLDATMSELEAKAKIMNRQRQRMYHNDGSGRLAEIATGSAGIGAVLSSATTYTLAVNSGIQSAATCQTPPVRFLKVGQILLIVDPTGATIKGVAKVATITAPNQVTFSATGLTATANNIAAGDFVVTYSEMPSAAGAIALKNSGYKNEPMGLAGILLDTNPADGTSGGFQGVDASAAANSWHRVNVLNGGGVLRAITLELLDQAWTTPIEIADSAPTVWYLSFPLLRKYAALFYGDRRWDGGYQTFDGGYKGLVYNNTPMLPDRDMYNGRIAGVDETDLSIYEMKGLTWMNKDGSTWSRLDDKDAYQATMYCRETMGSDVRDKHVIITDLAE